LRSFLDLHAGALGIKLLGAILLASLLAAPAKAPEPRARRAPDIVLVTIDTLRQDDVSCYGYRHPTTPFLDRLAREAVRFDRAYSTSSWTLPAIVSMLTGLDPAVHGMNDATTDDNGRLIRQPALPGDLAFLPQLLHARGYQTFGLTANEHLRGELGFRRGFDSFLGVGFRSGPSLREPLLEIRRRIDPKRPYFLWVHYLDPHLPYDSNLPMMREYLPDAVGPDRALLGRVQSANNPAALSNVDRARASEVLSYARASYDSDVRFVDRQVEKLFELLEIGKGALVVVVSDHGEEFMEHGAFGHGHTLFEELLRVPLLVRLPDGRGAGRTIGARVSVMDVFPTVLEAAGIEPPRFIQAASLLPLIERGEPARDRVIHASTLTDVEIDSLTVGRFKYIEPAGKPREAMLFDLDSDPGEHANVIAQYAGEVDGFRRALERLRESSRPEAPSSRVNFSPELRDAMRSLGYLH
jgi:arylsulfatase A-like enzyme